MIHGHDWSMDLFKIFCTEMMDSFINTLEIVADMLLGRKEWNM
jgi:hypothetical protein